HAGSGPAAEYAAPSLRLWKLIQEADNEAVLAIKFAKAIVRLFGILIGRDAGGSTGCGTAGCGAVSMSEGICSEKLQALAEAFGKARFQTVIPGGGGRIDIVQARRGEPEDRDPLGDVGDRVGGNVANRIASACDQRLVERAIDNLVRPSRAHVAYFKQV